MMTLRPLLALTLALAPFAARAATGEGQTTPAPAAAAATKHSEAKLKLAEAFLLAGGAKKNHEAGYSMMEDAYATGSEKMPEEQRARMRRIGAKMTALMQKELGWEVVKADYIRAAADTYTEAELKAAITFYSTPEGKSLAEKQPVFTKASAAIGMKRMQELQPKMTAIMMEEMQGDLAAAVAKQTGESTDKADKASPAQIRAREKALINNARQIASAANQFFAEHATNEVTVGDIRKAGYIARLSGGVKIAAFDKSHLTPAKPLDYASGEADAIVLKTGGHFALVHDKLTLAESTDEKLATAFGPEAKAFVFEVDTGGAAKK